MLVFLAGGTGFVGSHLLFKLNEYGHKVRVLTRRETMRSEISQKGGEPIIGDIMEPEVWENGVAGCEAIINLIGIIRETASSNFDELHNLAAARLINIAKEKGVSKFLHMSALGTREGAPSRYYSTKFKAEEVLKESGLNYIIFRPSIIFGPRDGFINMLADMIRKVPVVPVIGDGEYKMQPVSIHNVVECFVRGLEKEDVLNQTFEIGGPRALTYNSLLDEIMAALGVHKSKIHLPEALIKPVASVMELVLVNPLITREQMTMLLEDNVCDSRRVTEAFDLNLIPLSLGIREYIKPVK